MQNAWVRYQEKVLVDFTLEYNIVIYKHDLHQGPYRVNKESIFVAVQCSNYISLIY